MRTLQQTLDIVTNSVWQGLAETYPKLLRFDPPKIILCNRLTKTAGKNYQTLNKVHMANKFFARNYQEMLHVILPHELAHQADYNLFGESEKKCGHGVRWAEIMLQLGLPANKYHSLEI